MTEDQAREIYVWMEREDGPWGDCEQVSAFIAEAKKRGYFTNYINATNMRVDGDLLVKGMLIVRGDITAKTVTSLEGVIIAG